MNSISWLQDLVEVQPQKCDLCDLTQGMYEIQTFKVHSSNLMTQTLGVDSAT